MLTKDTLVVIIYIRGKGKQTKTKKEGKKHESN